jgi:1-acyl-sn-glycerol-3-phosphate acyltransferase
VYEVVERIRDTLAAGARITLAGIFHIVVRTIYSLEIHGLEYDDPAQRAYFALSHKRDVDPIILLPSLLRHRGWSALAGTVRFALRADAFTPGFLARLLGRTALSRALRPLALGSVVRGLGALPIDNLHRPTEEWLRDTLRIDGDAPAGDALAPPTLERLALAAREDAPHIASRSLSTFFAWRYFAELRSLRGSEVLTGARRSAAKRHLVMVVRAQLGALSAVLRNGGSLVGAPEGGVSQDGRVRPITSGFSHILRGAPADTRILPVVMTYDFMRSGRPRVFVDLAPPLSSLSSLSVLSERHLHADLRHAWLHAMRFTCTQFATGYLVWLSETGQGEFTVTEMASAVHGLALALTAAGRNVDSALLDAASTHRAITRYLAYAERHNLARRAKLGRWLSVPHDLTVRVNPANPAALGYASQPLAYAWNELLDLLGADGQTTSANAQLALHEDVKNWIQWIYARSTLAAPIY